MLSGGTISEGTGIPRGAMRSKGIGIAPLVPSLSGCVIRRSERCQHQRPGANRPPTLSGLPAGQRGCLDESQSRLSIPLACSSFARATISIADCAVFPRAAGRGELNAPFTRIRRYAAQRVRDIRFIAAGSATQARSPKVVGQARTTRQRRRLVTQSGMTVCLEE